LPGPDGGAPPEVPVWQNVGKLKRALPACELPNKLVSSNFHVPQRIPGKFFLRNLVGRRSLLFQLVRRDFEQRFVGSIIGWVWALIHPLVLLVCWWFVFSVSLKVAVPPGEGTRNYALFVFAGCCPGCCSARPCNVPLRAWSSRPT